VQFFFSIGGNVSNPIITSPEAHRVCTLSGLEQKRLSGDLIKLRDLEDTLDVAISKGKQAASDEDFWKAMEVSAKLVQVGCDLTIAVLEEAAQKAGLGMGARAVSTLYDVGKMVVDAMNKDVTVKKAIVFSTNAKVDGIAEILGDRGSNYGKVLSRAKVLVNLANDFYDYWSSGGKNLIENSGILSARKTAEGQLMRIRQQIREVNGLLEACSPDSSLAL